MADRMRTNSAGVAAGGYDNMGGLSVPPQPADITPADPHCMVGGCTPADLAQYDMHAWLVTLAQILPAGRGAVKRDAENSDFLITVAWDEARNGGGDSCLSGGQAPVPGKAYLACFQMSLSP
jgi:type IV pilus assembly protein PilV